MYGGFSLYGCLFKRVPLYYQDQYLCKLKYSYVGFPSASCGIRFKCHFFNLIICLFLVIYIFQRVRTSDYRAKHVYRSFVFQGGLALCCLPVCSHQRASKTHSVTRVNETP